MSENTVNENDKNNDSENKVSHIADVVRFDLKKFKEYMNDYSGFIVSKTNKGIVKDIIYGIGISIDKKYQYADGFQRWIKDLHNILNV